MRVLVVYTMFLALQLGPTESRAQPRRSVPVGDYHIHLMSESAARLLLGPTLAEVELPAESDLVIRQWSARSRRWIARRSRLRLRRTACWAWQTAGLAGARRSAAPRRSRGTAPFVELRYMVNRRLFDGLVVAVGASF